VTKRPPHMYHSWGSQTQEWYMCGGLLVTAYNS
jgi:hypothetical protein